MAYPALVWSSVTLAAMEGEPILDAGVSITISKHVFLHEKCAYQTRLEVIAFRLYRVILLVPSINFA